jgi:hypothetical protein
MEYTELAFYFDTILLSPGDKSVTITRVTASSFPNKMLALYINQY